MKTLLITTIASALLLFPIATASAQSNKTIYTVQTGDTLTHISLKYNVSVAELAAYNQLANPNLILAGQRLAIPGEASIDGTSQLETTYTIQPGDTLFAIASQFGVRTAHLAEANQITNVDLIEVGQVLKIPPETPVENSLPLPPPFETITLSEARVAQGRTLVVSVTLSTEAELTAQFEDRTFPLTGDGQNYWGLVGIHALSEIGVYQLAFRATLPDGSESAVAQNVVVAAGPYGVETIEVVPGREGLLDPDLIQAEADKLRAIWRVASPAKQWDGLFRYPVEEVRITSKFGTRRSYGAGPVNGFHGGADFGGGTGVPIYAPAAGTVVLAEALTVRGNAVIIDHGMGLYSGYWHQSESVATVGQQLAPGDLIGYIGDTGLVTGPHLHWEMRLGGIAVQPLQWLEESIP